MAFQDLKPVRARDDEKGCSYVIGSVFAAYEFNSDLPTVFTWDMISGVSINRKEFVFSAANQKFNISRKMFSSDEDILTAIAIVECHQKQYGFSYQHEKRMFPLKSSYSEFSAGRDTYIGEGMLEEGDVASSFIMLLNFKLIKMLWLVAILVAIGVMVILHFTIGVTRDNILYFIPISIAAGGISAVLVRIIAQAVARARFKSMSDADLASKHPITFVVSRTGFAACESCVYESRDLIPWSEVDYYIESDRMFILFKGNSAAAYIPKKAFEKKIVGDVADVIALCLEQR